MSEKSIYDDCLSAGLQIENRCSDMRVPVTAVSTRILKRYKFWCNVSVFIDEVDGRRWYDVPFAFDPWWNDAERQVVAWAARDGEP